MSQQLIKSISVQKLFGLYSYNIEYNQEHSDAVILYGDNGVGKSTVLRLAFHLLSASDSNGHRTALFNTNFAQLKVSLTSGVSFVAENTINDSKRRILRLSVYENGDLTARWNYSGEKNFSRRHELDDEYIIVSDNEPYEVAYHRMRELNVKPRNLGPLGRVTSKGLYLEKLGGYAPVTFILNADRRLDSDTIGDPDEEVEFRQVMKYGQLKRVQDLVLRSREIALTQALNAATKWIAKKAVQGTNQGSDNVHSTYIKILRHLISPSNNNDTEVTRTEVKVLLDKIESIGAESSELAKYELATALDMTEFSKALKKVSKSNSTLSIDLLKPYIQSLDGRLDAVRSLYKVVDKFVTTINELLTDKKIGFHLSQGFYIVNGFNEPLEPAQLSSGEQQLLLLFCYVLIARDMSSVFMIDEPEISLNIKWQRKLVQSLLNITDGANIQFIFASHSLEILSQHRNRVVKLVNAK